MNEPDAYDPIECPVDGCPYEDEIRSTAAHVSGTHGDDHSWEQLGYDGARAFVVAAKRDQIESDGAEPLESDGSTTGSELESDDRTTDLDLEFARSALVLVALVDEYEFDALEELDPFRLTNLYTLLSEIHRSANAARGTVRDALLEEIADDRSVQSDCGSIRRYTARTRQVKDESEVLERVERAGVDPEAVLGVDKSKLKSVVDRTEIDEAEVFETEESPRIRKADVDEATLETYLDALPAETRDLVEF